MRGRTRRPQKTLGATKRPRLGLGIKPGGLAGGGGEEADDDEEDDDRGLRFNVFGASVAIVGLQGRRRHGWIRLVSLVRAFLWEGPGASFEVRGWVVVIGPRPRGLAPKTSLKPGP